MVGFVKCFDSNKTMSFRVIDHKLLKNYKKIWEKVKKLMKIKFDSKPVYGGHDKYITTKIKLSGHKIFKAKKYQKNVSYKGLSLIMLDSVIRAIEINYPQTLLEECKYEMKKNKMEHLVSHDLDLSLSDESDSEPDNDFDNGFDNDESSD